MMQKGSFRGAGGARRILDLRDVVRRDRRKDAQFVAGIQRLMVGKQDEIADGGQIGAGRFGDLRNRIAAEFFDAINVTARDCSST